MKTNKDSSSYIDRLQKETAINAYLDLSNMFHWQEVLKWTFRMEDIIEQIQSISSVKEIKVYFGFNERNPLQSEGLHKRIRKSGAILRTKPVKYIKKTIESALLFKRSTLISFSPNLHTKIDSLVQEIKEAGIAIEEPKCNFDVEMTMDLMDDRDKVSAVMLFSGDSDLAAPLERLKLKGKKIYVVGVRGMTAAELHKVKDEYIDFGKFYQGTKRYGAPKSENPAKSGTA